MSEFQQAASQGKAKTVRLIIKLIFGALFLFLLIYAFIPAPLKVDIQAVEKGDLLITIEGEGKTRIHDIYVVSTPIDGRVTRIESEPGDRVVAGQTIIANMYPTDPRFLDKRSETQARADVQGAQAALALANARVKQAQAQLEFEQANFKRIKELFKQQSVSEAQMDSAELRLKTLHAELETAESNKQVMVARLEAAKANLLQPDDTAADNRLSGCQICIHSPVDGELLRILHENEGVVPMGTPLVEVGNIEDLEAVIELLSTNAVKVSIGDKALIKRWGGDEDIEARVKLIEPAGFTKISALGVEEQRVNVVLSLIDAKEKWQSLGHAYRVEAAIIIDQATEVIKVPLSALFRHNEAWSVFKVVDNVATIQTVTVGKRNDREAEIIQGLNAEDNIIIHPGNQLTDGSSVVQR